MTEPSRPPKIVSRQRAWVCAAMNQLAFPGLGTIMAGRRIGYVQATIMVTGFCLFVGFMLWYFAAFGRFITSGGDEEQFKATFRSTVWMLCSGLGLCAFAWGWSLVSSISILRKSQPVALLAPPRIQ